MAAGAERPVEVRRARVGRVPADDALPDAAAFLDAVAAGHCELLLNVHIEREVQSTISVQ